MSSNANVVLLITAENKASQVLQNIQVQAANTQVSINQANERTAQSTQKVERNYLQAGAAFAAVGASVVGFATSLDNMEKVQLKVDIAQKRVNDLLGRGKEGTEEYRIASEKLRLAQDNLNDSYTNFIAGIGPQIFSIIFGLQAGFAALKITSVSQLIPAIKGVGTALKTAFITNPVGIAILAITTVIGLLVFNVGGFRDRIVELGQHIFAFINIHLKPLGDAILFIIDRFRPLADIFGIVMPQKINTTQEAITKLERVTVPSFDNIQQETVKLGTAVGTTMEKINKDFEGQSARMVLTGQAVARVFENIHNLAIESRGITLEGPPLSRESDLVQLLVENPQFADIEELGRLARIAQSLEIARGIDPFVLFGGGTRDKFGLTLSPDKLQAVTAFGTLITRLSDRSLANAVSISEAISRGLGRFDVSGALSRIQGVTPRPFSGFSPRFNPGGQQLSRQQFFALTRAQHGFEGIFDRPTLLPLMVGEGGVKEHVTVSPLTKHGRPLEIHFQINDREIGVATIEDLDELARQGGVKKITLQTRSTFTGIM